MAALLLWDLRQDAERQSEITSRSLIQVLGRDIARNIDLYDLSLQAVVAGLGRSDIMALDPEIRRSVLFDRAAAAPGFGMIIVVDEHGQTTLSSKPLNVSFSCATCEYFRYFATHADSGLHISPPTFSRATGRQVVVLSRRLTRPDGSFAGVVSGAILLDYFRSLFMAVGIDHAGVVTLYGADGRIIMREPFRAEDIGASVARAPSYRKLIEICNGAFVGPAMIGEGLRHFVVTSVGDLPLHLSIATTPEEIYGGWWWKASVLGVVVLSLSAVTIVMTSLFHRELEERKSAERRTAAINVELEKLAVTDGLTGLFNRRRFDEVLDREWRRAVRLGKPLSLLLLDADWFKGFNDCHGHQRGDEALKLIARAIDASVDAAMGVGCRIGGEEFAVLLPDGDAEAAEATAERIRQLVAAWKLSHPVSAHGVLTLSGGIAQGPAADVGSPADLVAAADAALYQAKLAGRNSVRRMGLLDASSPLRLVAPEPLRDAG